MHGSPDLFDSSECISSRGIHCVCVSAVLCSCYPLQAYGCREMMVQALIERYYQAEAEFAGEFDDDYDDEDDQIKENLNKRAKRAFPPLVSETEFGLTNETNEDSLVSSHTSDVSEASSCSSSSSLNGDTIPAADASLKHNSAQRRGCCCAQKRKKGSAPPESYYRAFSAAVLLLVTSSVAVSVKNLGVILGLTGSTAYMALMFILPVRPRSAHRTPLRC